MLVDRDFEIISSTGDVVVVKVLNGTVRYYLARIISDDSVETIEEIKDLTDSFDNLGISSPELIGFHVAGVLIDVVAGYSKNQGYGYVENDGKFFGFWFNRHDLSFVEKLNSFKNSSVVVSGSYLGSLDPEKPPKPEWNTADSVELI